MQATQSNNASGRRGLASPFAAPIEAARKYLDRQRGERLAGAAPDLPDLNDLSHLSNGSGWEAGSAAGGGNGLERSPGGSAGIFQGFDDGSPVSGFSIGEGLQRGEELLFEPIANGGQGKSIARLSPEHPALQDQHRMEEYGRDESGHEAGRDEGGPVFTFEPSLAAPDANAVRAAIFRLSRESKLPQKMPQRVQPGLSDDPNLPAFPRTGPQAAQAPSSDKRSAGPGTAPSGPLPLPLGTPHLPVGTSYLPSGTPHSGTRQSGAATAPSLQQATHVAQHVMAQEEDYWRADLRNTVAQDLQDEDHSRNSPPMAFADVARLVWSPGTAAAPADLPKQGIEEEDAAAPGSEWRDMLAAPAAAVSGPLPTDPSPAIVQETGRRPELDWNYEVNGEDVNDEAARETSSGVSIQSASYSAPDSVRDGTSAGPALAHDANNLLSALRLYSELLGFGGVLNPEHRHYADDLRLLADRSQELMERLLERDQVRGQGQAAAPSPAVSPGEPTPEVGEAAGLAAARPCQDETKIQERAQSIRRTSEPPRGPVTPADGWLQVETGCVAPPVPAEMAGGAQLAGETEARQSGGQRRHGPTQEAGATPAADTSAPGKPAPGEAAPGEATPGEAARTNLVDLLLRWGSLLSTLAHGALEVRFGPRAAAPIAVEAEAIERILVNLVRNAAAATRNGGAIRIGVGARGPDRPDLSQAVGGREVMVLTVDDSGDGMTAQQVDRALGRDERPAPSGAAAKQTLTLVGRQEPADRFVSGYGSWPGCRLEEQARETRTADAAVAAIRDFIDEIDEKVTANSSLQSAQNSVRRHGLGLAIVRGLVRSSGGSLSIHSRPGLGTRIEIRWPTATAEASAIRQSDSELKRRSGSPSKGIGNEEKRTAERLLPNTAPGRNGAESGSTATQIGVGREGAIAC